MTLISSLQDHEHQSPHAETQVTPPGPLAGCFHTTSIQHELPGVEGLTNGPGVAGARKGPQEMTSKSCSVSTSRSANWTCPIKASSFGFALRLGILESEAWSPADLEEHMECRLEGEKILWASCKRMRLR